MQAWWLTGMAGSYFAAGLLAFVLEAAPPRGPCLGLGGGLAVLALLRPRGFLLCLAATCLAWSRSPIPEAPPGTPFTRVIEFEARVRALEVDHWGRTWLHLDRLSGGLPSLWTKAEAQPALQSGRRVRVRALAQFDGQRVRLRQLLATDLTPAAPLSMLQRLRDATRNRLQQQLSPAEAKLARALLLGESQAGPTSLRAAYRELGLLHLLTISGMHIWVWSWLLHSLLPRRVRWLRLPLLLAILALAEFSLPVVRAGLALALREFFCRLGWKIPTLPIWSLALCLELLLPRSSPIRAGFLLSFGATLGVLWGVRHARRAWSRVLLPSLGAFLFTTPVVHRWQGTMEWWSIPLTPLAGALLPLRLLCSGISLLPGGGGIASPLMQSLSVVEDLALRAASTLPGTPWAAYHLAPLQVLLACLLSLGLCSLTRWRSRALALLPLLLLFRLSSTPREALGFVSDHDHLVWLQRDGAHVVAAAGTAPSPREFDWHWVPHLRAARAVGPLVVYHKQELDLQGWQQLQAERGLRLALSPKPALFHERKLWTASGQVLVGWEARFLSHRLMFLAQPLSLSCLELCSYLAPQSVDVLICTDVPEDRLSFLALCQHLGVQALWLPTVEQSRSWNQQRGPGSPVADARRLEEKVSPW